MNPHYSMVFINLCIVACVALGLAYWKFKLRKPVSLVALLLIISLFPLFSMLRPGPYESGDMGLHATRAMMFYESITQFHQLPRWAADLHFGYGDAYFQFLYVTPYLLISLFHAFGASFIDSTKLVFAGTYIASGFLMYTWIKDAFGKKAGFISALFYLYAPYHLVDMHFRATIAESTSFLFLPLLMLLTLRWFRSKHLRYLVVLALSYAFFLLTHAVIFLAFTPFMLVYALMTWRSQNQQSMRLLVQYGASLVLGFSLTTFYWLPILAESAYIYQSLETQIVFNQLWMYIVSPWRFGLLFQGQFGELSYVIGYTQLIVIGMAMYMLWKRKIHQSQKGFVLFSVISIAGIFTMMQPFTASLWQMLPLIKNIQFVYRLLELIVFFIAAIAGVVLLKIQRSYVVVGFCVVTVLYTALNWGNRGTLPNVTDAVLLDQLKHGQLATGYFEPTSPIWVNRDDPELMLRPSEFVRVATGSATLTIQKHTAILHVYSIDAQTDTVIRDNTFYFPGWTGYLDGVPADPMYEKKTYGGVMHFAVPAGKHELRVVFEDSRIRRTATNISTWIGGASIISVLIFVMRKSTIWR